MKQKYDQLEKSAKQWNEEENSDFWDVSYKEDTHTGNKLRSREKKVLEYLDSLHLKKCSKVLDLGCGAGVTSSKIYNRGFNVVGVDISRPLCDLAVKNCEKIRTKSNKAKFKFIVGNAEQLDFPDNSFDCVVGLGFLQYLEHPDACLREVYRVLKPKGHFIITQRNVYGISSMDGSIKLCRSLIYLMGFKYEVHKLWKIKKNALSFGRMKKLIEDSNLKIIKYDGAGYLTKKSVLFPRLAKRLDEYLQKANDTKKIPGIYKFGNSVVFLAKK